MTMRPPQRFWSSGRVLFAGFGGLLALMAASGVDALLAIHDARTASAQLRQSYLTRSRALDEIRSGIYISGSVARDYLLAADSTEAARQRTKLHSVEQHTDAALDNYSRSLTSAESATFRNLQAEIHTYWRVLDFMLDPNREPQRTRTSPYFYNQLVSRRDAMLDLAGRIERWNEQEAASGDRRLAAMFSQTRLRLSVILGVTLAAGLVLALVTAKRLLRTQAELKELSSRLLSAQEQERRSISRELHDEVGQSLTALLMEAGAAEAGQPALQQRLQSIQRLAENSLSAVRNMALLLRPSMLDDLGLVPALQWQAKEVAKRTGIKVRVTAEDVADDLPDEHKTCIYRVAQEALNNSVRHAHARSVRIQVSGSNGAVRLMIQDDGDGFDARNTRGLGLLGMAERVQHAGGAFQVESQPGGGATLSVTLPLNGTHSGEPHP